ncbi:MAG: hypothetical protein JW797_14685 [Bradymonadales bacterium]|nr:hypothetical protein [Bradymonadales bacterium]
MSRFYASLLFIASMFLWISGCSDTVVQPEPEVGFSVTAGPLDSAATHAVICLAFLGNPELCPVGTLVETTLDGSTRVARATFPRIAEDAVRAEAYAWRFFTPSVTGFSEWSFQSTDAGVQPLHVTSGTQQGIQITTSDAGGTSAFSAERPILNADYLFDATGLHAGSLDGSNITRLVIDDLTGATSVTVTVRSPDGMGSNSNGLFTTLPDVSSGQFWPDPSTWPSTVSNVPLNGGDRVLYLVAKPGTAGFVDHVTLAPNSGTILYLYVRTSGLASLAVEAR